MSSKNLLKVINILTKFAHNFFLPVIPLKFVNPNKVAIVIKHKRRNLIISFAIYCLLFISSSSQILGILLSTDKLNLIALLFHGFILITCVAGFPAYQFLATEFCALLNCMLNNAKGLVSTYLQYSIRGYQNKRHKNILLVVSIGLSLTFYAIYIAIIPCVSFIFPCLFESFVYSYVFGNCQSFQFRVFVFVQSIIFLTPLGLVAPVTLVTIFAAIIKITENLNYLNSFLENNAVTRNPTFYHLVSLCYSQVQLFAILCNECYQMYVWPAMEFVGATGIIALLYTLLILDNVLSRVIKLVLVIDIVVICCATCIPLSVGNHALQLSKVIVIKLQRTKFVKQDNSKWIGKFIKSCAPITLKVGSFHKMDRVRTPNLMRFILQRTFFLVFKTKQAGL